MKMLVVGNLPNHSTEMILGVGMPEKLVSVTEFSCILYLPFTHIINNCLSI